ncbi:hypothetical protein ACJJIU_11210 [Microbulbifer sp. CnH-101-E]|uniref:hypothetical protein n=1 Tax=unclassified Microbulbifer TaxID=2619833 RepID=UPI00403993CA
MKKVVCYFLFHLISYNCLAENKDMIPPLSPGEGYAILPLSIHGTPPKSVKLQDPKSFGKSFIFKSPATGNNFKIIKLPAGNYRWTKVIANRNYLFNLKEKQFDLIIHEGAINYGGHLTIDINWTFGTATFDYLNRSSETIEELESCCQKLLEQHPLTFTGNTKDPFIKFYLETIQMGSTK